jgi:chromosome segregation ATPase
MNANDFLEYCRNGLTFIGILTVLRAFSVSSRDYSKFSTRSLYELTEDISSLKQDISQLVNVISGNPQNWSVHIDMSEKLSDQLESIYRRFNTVEGRLSLTSSNHETNIEQLNNNLKVVYGEIKNVQHQLSSAKETIQTQDNHFTTLSKKLTVNDAILQQIDKVSKRIDSKIEILNNKEYMTNSLYENLYSSILKLEKEKEQLQQVNQYLAKEKDKLKEQSRYDEETLVEKDEIIASLMAQLSKLGNEAQNKGIDTEQANAEILKSKQHNKFMNKLATTYCN